MSKFASGDVVTLKSGGPNMTIKHMEEDLGDVIGVQITCTWFDKSKELQHAIFGENMIEKPSGPPMPFSV
ncbi:DUF2158 domain-containing protein [Pseudomonas sp. SWRI154]|uniref:DUF2158 domain-containing protein n=1 Tax=Pseudomonas sp. SWRI154 TaxID=2745501 RepID=UPI0016490CE5|nr:DUF2158 domain-containing protein [Pseudomonas sp. SWRI154]MBC3364130.1 DUF2158 domain-containing protein [Pseudomonas sp. SWRI154]